MSIFNGGWIGGLLNKLERKGELGKERKKNKEENGQGRRERKKEIEERIGDGLPSLFLDLVR